MVGTESTFLKFKFSENLKFFCINILNSTVEKMKVPVSRRGQFVRLIGNIWTLSRLGNPPEYLAILSSEMGDVNKIITWQGV